MLVWREVRAPKLRPRTSGLPTGDETEPRCAKTGDGELETDPTSKQGSWLNVTTDHYYVLFGGAIAVGVTSWRDDRP